MERGAGRVVGVGAVGGRFVPREGRDARVVDVVEFHIKRVFRLGSVPVLRNEVADLRLRYGTVRYGEGRAVKSSVS